MFAPLAANAAPLVPEPRAPSNTSAETQPPRPQSPSPARKRPPSRQTSAEIYRVGRAGRTKAAEKTQRQWEATRGEEERNHPPEPSPRPRGVRATRLPRDRPRA